MVGCWPAELRQRCLAAAPPDECGGGRQGARAGGPRALCIGVGGGALPLFLAHAFPGLMVEAVRGTVCSPPVGIRRAGPGFPGLRSTRRVALLARADRRFALPTTVST